MYSQDSQNKTKTKTAETWIWRKLLKISWQEKTTNAGLQLSEINVEKELPWEDSDPEDRLLWPRS